MHFQEFIEKRMTGGRRVKLALLLGANILLALYAPYIFMGYVRWGAFPLICFFTDLPHCPRCDNLHIHLPLVEWLLISIPVYWLCMGIARWQRRKRLKSYLAQNP